METLPHRSPRVERRFVAAIAALAAALAGGAMLAAQPRTARGPTHGGVAGETGTSLWISATPLDDGRQLLLVVDPAARNAAVYHVDAATGALTLRSTRNITWDLLVPEYNAQEPRPAALRKMVENGAETVPTGQDRR